MIIELEGVSLLVMSSAFVSPSLLAAAGGPQGLLKLGISAAVRSIYELYTTLGEDRVGLIFKTRESSDFFSYALNLPVAYQTSFNVSITRDVSVLNPIGRLVSRFIVAACNEGSDFNLRDLFDWESSPIWYSSTCFICEYALRSLSFSAQMDCGMWRRNGMGVANLLYNYGRPPLCRHFRDLDICTVQLSIAWFGPEVIYRNMMSHFECDPVDILSSKRTVLSVKSILDISTRGLLLSEFLRLLILVVAYVPVDLKTNEQHDSAEDSKEDCVRGDMPFSSGEGLRLALDRLIAHKVLSGSNTIAELAPVKPLLGNGNLVGERHIDSSVEQLCMSRPHMETSKSAEAATFTYRPEKVLPLFDPECPILSSTEIQQAAETVKECLQKPDIRSSIKEAFGAHGSAFPVLSKSAVPIPHREFAIVRRMLYSPVLLDSLTAALTLCIDSKKVNLGSDNSPSKMPKSTAISIASRCVHVCTLQLHCLDMCKDVVVDKDGRSEYLHDLWKGAEMFLTRECSHSEPLLRALVMLLESGLLAEDVCYGRGLEWVIIECGHRSEDAKEYLISCGVKFFNDEKSQGQSEESSSGGDAEAERKKKLEQRKLAARNRAMAAMQKKATNFEALLNDMKEDEEPEDECTLRMPECIICRCPISLILTSNFIYNPCLIQRKHAQTDGILCSRPAFPSSL